MVFRDISLSLFSKPLVCNSSGNDKISTVVPGPCVLANTLISKVTSACQVVFTVGLRELPVYGTNCTWATFITPRHRMCCGAYGMQNPPRPLASCPLPSAAARSDCGRASFSIRTPCRLPPRPAATAPTQDCRPRLPAQPPFGQTSWQSSFGP